MYSCTFVPKPTKEELRLLDNPPATLRTELKLLVPMAIKWYDEVERKYYSQGRILTYTEKIRAKDIGIQNVNRLRIVILNELPMPDTILLRKKAEKYGLGNSYEGARTMGNIIFIKPRYKDNSTIISHELVHIYQQEVLGRKAFIERYIIEMEIMGYLRSPLELEAYKNQGEI